MGEVHDLVGRILGQQHTGQQTREKKTVQPQTEEQRGKRACALTERGSISKVTKGLVGGAATGSAEYRKHLTTALILRNSGQDTHPSISKQAQTTRAAWGGGRHKTARSAARGQGRSKTGIASLLHVKLAPTSAPSPTGERQEHLDAIIAFAGPGQKRRLFRILDILTVKWATEHVPEERRFLLNAQLMFLKKEKDPTTPR